MGEFNKTDLGNELRQIALRRHESSRSCESELDVGQIVCVSGKALQRTVDFLHILFELRDRVRRWTLGLQNVFLLLHQLAKLDLKLELQVHKCALDCCETKGHACLNAFVKCAMSLVDVVQGVRVLSSAF